MNNNSSKSQDCFTAFRAEVNDIPLPKRFTFPFYYDPHPLCLIAAKELQDHLETQTDWQHNFGIDPSKEGLIIGKMFGVMVVRNQTGQVGYLSAFSGKLAGGNHHPGFVPPVFDMLDEEGFFRKEEKVLNDFNRQIEILEADPEWLASKAHLEQEKNSYAQALNELKQRIKKGKQLRKICRKKYEPIVSAEAFDILREELREESLRDQFYLKDFTRYWKRRLDKSQQVVNTFADRITALKEKRKAMSSALQQKLFDHYHFLNANRESKSLATIFANTTQLTPPAGAGECAAPKLLQYAFQNGMEPICMAEFWWGQSPKSEIRKQGHFYPACRGKCRPILGHMLEGLEVDENPMLNNPAEGKQLPVFYEDEAILIVNKPAEFLSVPGKNIEDSVLRRLELQYPNATGPLLVHRLDMSTSGILLAAKTKEYHKFIQRQFLKRKVKKRYVAILEGLLKKEEGEIDLPLRVDLDDRPRQLVCYEYGKPAQTKWKVIEKNAQTTRVHFFPITGRTHQLRVHAAHPLGLNHPILGDDLYGKKEKRLYLHAEYLEFTHPLTKAIFKITIPPGF